MLHHLIAHIKIFCTQVTKPPVSSPCNTNDQYCKDAMAYRDWCSMSKHTSKLASKTK